MVETLVASCNCPLESILIVAVAFVEIISAAGIAFTSPNKFLNNKPKSYIRNKKRLIGGFY
jgi:hypothetical protein